MEKQRLYIVYGTGADSVGLVGKITARIAEVKGNVVDLRQDVLHGLFTIFMVVDLAESGARIEQFKTVIKEIAEDTGLQLTVDKYSPVPRSADKKNLLTVLIGRDRPGIIAASCEMFAQYNVNIEFARTIGREGIFLMELLTDFSHGTIPLDNLMNTLRRNMAALNIQTIFQDQDVFNKKKRLILFNISSSFINRSTRAEILRQTGIDSQALGAVYSGADLPTALRNALARLEGFPQNVFETIIKQVSVTQGSQELVQTLKIMGYAVVLVSNAFSPVTDHIRAKLDLDTSFGITMPVDDDSRAIVGEFRPGEGLGHDLAGIIARIAERASIDKSDITVITDEGCDDTPGIRIAVGTDILLDCYNKRIVSRENLIGLLGSFGIVA
jgi:phosphoserine phosphatase